MPLLLGTKGNDILKWRASAGLVADLKGKLTHKWEQCRAGDAQAFLERFIAALREERDHEAELECELGALNREIAAAAAPAELLALQARYLELVSAHFRRRKSVLALCDSCNRLHDAVLAKAASFANGRMLELGQGCAPDYALLVAGDRGRREQTLRGKNRYFLLHEEQSPRFVLFGRQFAAALQELGLPADAQALWQGGLREWRNFLSGSFPQAALGAPETFLAALPPFAAPNRPGSQESPDSGWRLEALADLGLVQGDPSLGAGALDAAAQIMQRERTRDPFLQLARRVIGLPLAMGRFGWWRLERSGEHRGELDLEQLALAPLVMTLRVLAVHNGIRAGGSVERIERLLEKGALDVDLAGRLLKAYRCFMQQKILSEMRGEEGGAFCNPEQLGEEEEADFRSSLEAVLSLQKIAYQRLVAQG